MFYEISVYRNAKKHMCSEYFETEEKANKFKAFIESKGFVGILIERKFNNRTYD